MENTKKSVQKTPSKLENVSNLVSKALTSRSKWDSKDQYLDVVYWIRQVVGFIIGVFWGFLHFKGMFAIISFALVSSLIIYVYTVSFQQVDVEEYGGIWDIVKEGFMTCFSTFLVTWIVIHSSLLE